MSKAVEESYSGKAYYVNGESHAVIVHPALRADRGADFRYDADLDTWVERVEKRETSK